MKCSNIKVKWQKALVMYCILMFQAVAIIVTQRILVASLGLIVLIALNWDTILWAKSKWKNLIRRKI